MNTLMLDYRPNDSRPFRAQKVAALLTGVCGAAMALGVRLYTVYYPGDNAWALGALVMGWAFVIVGAVWYLACRKSEG